MPAAAVQRKAREKLRLRSMPAVPTITEPSALTLDADDQFPPLSSPKLVIPSAVVQRKARESQFGVLVVELPTTVEPLALTARATELPRPPPRAPRSVISAPTAAPVPSTVPAINAAIVTRLNRIAAAPIVFGAAHRNSRWFGLNDVMKCSGQMLGNQCLGSEICMRPAAGPFRRAQSGRTLQACSCRAIPQMRRVGMFI